MQWRTPATSTIKHFTALCDICLIISCITYSRQLLTLYYYYPYICHMQRLIPSNNIWKMIRWLGWREGEEGIGFNRNKSQQSHRFRTSISKSIRIKALVTKSQSTWGVLTLKAGWSMTGLGNSRGVGKSGLFGSYTSTPRAWKNVTISLGHKLYHRLIVQRVQEWTAIFYYPTTRGIIVSIQ